MSASNGAPPCVGVLCVDIASSLRAHYSQNDAQPYHSYIPSSYQKYLEAAGALVVPIWIGRERDYYEVTMKRLNGVLLPGGAVFLDDEDVQKQPELTNDCVKSAQYICELAMEFNASGQHFPLWGTCLGFQLLMVNAAKSSLVRTDCTRMFDSLPLQLSPDYKDSQLFKLLPADLAKEMTLEPFACHQHRYCITEPSLNNYPQHKDWQVLATSEDANNQRFITLIEHRKYPIFGCQFHPEKPAFEPLFMGKNSCTKSHTDNCIKLTRYFADTFVEECRRNGNTFESVEQKLRHMIWNWKPVFSGQFSNSLWVQCYLFAKNEDYPEATAIRTV